MKPFLAVVALLFCVSVQSETIVYYRPRLTPHIAAQVDSRITPAGATKEIFASQDHVTPAYVRSSTCWARDIDLTCASPWNSDGGATKGGTLISPRHILFANHFAIANGATVRFVKMDGTAVNRTITGRQLAYVDTMAALLDSDVPAGISFAKLLPANTNAMLSSTTPRMFLDQEEKALVDELLLPWWNPAIPADPTRASFYETPISGDSGNPYFVIVRGQAVLTSVGAGEPLHMHLTEINAAMTALGGGYQVTTVNLSEFVGGE